MKLQKVHILVLLILLSGISTFVAFTAIANSTVSLEINEAYYQLDTNGDLTIQIIGTNTGFSIVNSESQLLIPENFVIQTQANGKPVLEIRNEGLAIEKTQLSEHFEISFIVEVYASTSLPINYSFSLVTKSETFNNIITPRWRSLSSEVRNEGGGRGAFSAPYITSYYAYDRNKGESGKFKTYVYNSYPIERVLAYIDHKINGIDYDDWKDIARKNHGVEMDPFSTYVATDYIGPMFAATSNKDYALNVGDYKVINVYAHGGGWSDTHYPSTSQGAFVINEASGGSAKKIFSVVLYDSALTAFSWITSSFTVSDFVEYTVSHPVKVDDDGDFTEYSDGLEEVKNIVFMPYCLSWSPSLSSESVTVLESEALEKGGDLLGLSGDWNVTDPASASESLTSAKNHGFDQLIGLTGQYDNNNVEPHGKSGDESGSNVLVVFCKDRNETRPKVYSGYVLLHEVSHNLGATHDNIPSHYIMKTLPYPVVIENWCYKQLSVGRMIYNFEG